MKCGLGSRSSKGAALLAFMLVLITGSTWVFLSDLNRHSAVYVRRANSGFALNQAKQALLFYAMNYPELRANPEKGPGFLPCPDRNNDGRPESNCASGTGTTLGRLPFRILGLDDPRDSSGERLWYALSPDFRNTRTNQAVINSETPGQLNVDGTGDVVAIVMAPGPPAGNQYARPGNNPVDYLEGDNAYVADGIFSAAAGNDRLAVITRAELMAVVELRVINEIRAALARYRAEHSAYPWLAPFADPHADDRVLRGTHTGSNNAAALTDSRKDFIAWGVVPYDIVRNVTDGSTAIVKTVNKKLLGVAGQATGRENDFDKGDIYFIERRALVHTMSGAAAAGSSGFTLNDTNKDFVKLGVIPGDLVENLSDGSSGAITTVTATALTAGSLTGGLENDFDFGERYRLRSNTGVAGPGSLGRKLADPHADFVAGGIVRGDLLVNLSDGSVGRVVNIDSPTVLTVSGLGYGRQNKFSEDDIYRLPRYNGRKNTRKGLLPVHEPGKRFPTGFGVEWNVPMPGSRVITGITPGTSPGYAASVTRLLQSSAATGTLSVSDENGHCIWLNAQVVDCTGTSAPVPVLEGSASPGTTAGVLVDNAGDFVAAGIKPGDLVEEPYFAVVTHVVNPTTLVVTQLLAASPAMAESDHYRMRTATRELTGITGAPDSDRLQDPGRDFSAAGVRAGDVVENVTDGSYGLITGVGAAHIRAALHGGKDNSFRTGDEYHVYYAYVNRRRYRFNLRYQGNMVVRSAGGMRQRVVCRGYGAGCDGAPGSAVLPYHGSGINGTAGPGSTGLYLDDAGMDFIRLDVVPGDTLFNTTDGSAGMVTATGRHSLTIGTLDGGHGNDFDAGDAYLISRPLVVIEDLRDESVVTRIGLTVLPGGAPGSIRTGSLDYFLSEDRGELPAWFIKNRWHHLLYVAYGAGFTPGGSGMCTAGAGCLVIQGRADDREALVASAGMALATQDRSTGAITDYYEGENATLSGDDIFTVDETSAIFNDQLSVVAP